MNLLEDICPSLLPFLPCFPSFLSNWNFMASDILLGKRQAEALGGKSFGCKELIFMMGSDLYHVGLAHASPEFCFELQFNLAPKSSTIQRWLLCKEIV